MGSTWHRSTFAYVREGKLDLSDNSMFQAEDRPACAVDALIKWVTEAALHLQDRVGPL